MGDLSNQRKPGPFFGGENTPGERGTHNTSYNSYATETKTIPINNDDSGIQNIDYKYTANLPFEIGGRNNVIFNSNI
jgi:hypothetical protein